MKKLTAMLAVLLSICLFVSAAAAAETMKGMIKKVDTKAGTITFVHEGAKEEMVMKVDPSVDLKGVKAKSKAEITVDGGVVKEIKAEKAEAKPKTPGY